MSGGDLWSSIASRTSNGFEEFFETKHIHWEINSGMKPWWFPWDE
jgi:hypothetical protein